jgi:hypothetical protein
MRPALLSTLAALAACVPLERDPEEPFGDEAPGFQGRLEGSIGLRQLDDDAAWSPLDEAIDLGLDLAIGPEGGIVQGQVGLHWAYDDATGTAAFGERKDLDLVTWELLGGVVKMFRIPGVMARPYLGAGASLLRVDADFIDRGERVGGDDWTLGVYGRVGLLMEFSPDHYAGVDVRHLTGTDVDIQGLTEDADGTIVSVVFGYSF